MRPYILLSLLLTALTTALPRSTEIPSNVLPLPSSEQSIPVTFMISSFVAYLPTSLVSPSPYPQHSFITFLITDGRHDTICSAGGGPATQLFTVAGEPYTYHECEKSEADERNGPMYEFAVVGDTVDRVAVKKFWNNKGDWLTGFAERGGYWDEGVGGNVTVGESGKTYARGGDWEFEITSVIG